MKPILVTMVKILINCHLWHINVVPENDLRLIKNGTQLDGCSRLYEREIIIKNSLQKSMFRQVLIHELSHAYLAETDISQETRVSYSEEELCTFNEYNAEMIVNTANSVTEIVYKRRKIK